MKDHNLIFVTRDGLVKQVPSSEFETNNRLVAATRLNDGDRLIAVAQINDPGTDVVLQSDNDYLLRFPVAEVTELKKNSKGVRGMHLGKGEGLTAMYLLNEIGNAVVRGRDYAVNRLKCAHRDQKGTKARA